MFSAASVEDKFTKAKLKLREEVPFFGQILYGLTSQPSTRPDVGAVDVEGNHVYNPEYFQNASLQETVFHLFHEANHVAKEHLFRRNGRDPELWNVAADLVVNADAHQLGIEVPDEFYFDERFVDKSVEEVYLELLEERDQEQQQQQDQEEGNGSSGDESGEEGDEGQGDEEGQSEEGNDGSDSSSDGEDEKEGEERDESGNEEEAPNQDDGVTGSEASQGGQNGQEENEEDDAGEGTGGGSEPGSEPQNEDNSGTTDSRGHGEGDGDSLSPKQKATQKIVEKYGGGNPDDHLETENLDGEELSPAEKHQARQELRRIVSRATVYAKEQGDLPSHLEEDLEKLHKDTLDWYTRTEEFVQNAEASNWTWTRKPKTTWTTGIRLPAIQKEKIRGAVLLDTSLSMGREEVQDSLSETQALLDCRPNTEILVLEHTTGVNRTYTLGGNTGLDQVKTENLQRGGTSHLDAFRKLEKDHRQFDFAIAFTDGKTSFPDQAPIFPVLWIVPEHGANENRFPFGEVTYLPSSSTEKTS